MEILFAHRYHWTPDQVEALDADYVDETRVFWEALHDHETAQPKPDTKPPRRRR
jgi:hypothetical protein